MPVMQNWTYKSNVLKRAAVRKAAEEFGFTSLEAQDLPIDQMGLSKETEAFVWSIADDAANTKIIAAYIKEKDDEIVRLKGELDQALELLEACVDFVEADDD